jgi:hypothetical protein
MAMVKSSRKTRTSLIYALYDSLNAEKVLPDVATDINTSRYDGSTGTFYCGGENDIKYEKKEMDEAEKYFSESYKIFMKTSSNNGGSDAAKKANYCQIALEAIRFVKKQN